MLSSIFSPYLKPPRKRGVVDPLLSDRPGSSLYLLPSNPQTWGAGYQYTPVRKVLAQRKVPWQSLGSNRCMGTRFFQTSAAEIMWGNRPMHQPRPTVPRNPKPHNGTSKYSCLSLKIWTKLCCCRVGWSQTSKKLFSDSLGAWYSTVNSTECC